MIFMLEMKIVSYFCSIYWDLPNIPNHDIPSNSLFDSSECFFLSPLANAGRRGRLLISVHTWMILQANEPFWYRQLHLTILADVFVLISTSPRLTSSPLKLPSNYVAYRRKSSRSFPQTN